jgi:AcrR family transcriptional regulator
MKIFTRFRILNATRAMVAEVGVERVTMRGIAALANITAPAIYKHFRNKRALLEEVVTRGYVELTQKMLLRDKPKANAPERVRAMVAETRNYAERFPRLFEMMVAPRSEDGVAVDRLEQELLAGMRKREIGWNNPRDAAIALWSQMRGFLSRRPEGDYGATMEPLLRPLLQTSGCSDFQRMAV